MNTKKAIDAIDGISSQWAMPRPVRRSDWVLAVYSSLYRCPIGPEALSVTLNGTWSLWDVAGLDWLAHKEEVEEISSCPRPFCLGEAGTAMYY